MTYHLAFALVVTAILATACLPTGAPAGEIAPDMAGFSASSCSGHILSATATPVVSRLLVWGSSDPCVVFIPTAMPPATATAGPGLGAYTSSRPRWLSQGRPYELLNVFPVDGGYVAFRRPDGLALQAARSDAPMMYPQGETIAIARRADGQVAVGFIRGGLVEVRLARHVAQTTEANGYNDTPLLLPSGGTDLAMAFGPDGWLYVASGGVVAKYNPFELRWDGSGTYTGEVLQLTRTNGGVMLLLSTAGLWRMPVGGGAVDLILSRPFAPYTRLAVWRERVAFAETTWREWHVFVSEDAGNTWPLVSDVAAYDSTCDCALEPFATFNSDGSLDIVGRVTDAYIPFELDDGSDVADPSKLPEAPDQSFTYLAVARKTGSDGENGWHPVVGSRILESLLEVTLIRPVRGVQCASEYGLTVCAYEVRQWNEGYELETITR